MLSGRSTINLAEACTFFGFVMIDQLIGTLLMFSYTSRFFTDLAEVTKNDLQDKQLSNLHYSQKANKLLYILVSVMLRTKACKNSICLLFSGAFTSGHLLRCESLEIDYYVGGFRRLASDQN